jgi:tetratricopeptide (TPR) repeat protein
MLLFGAAWFLMFLLPTLLYRHELGGNAYDYLEHRAYLPLIGILCFAALYLTNFWKEDKKQFFNVGGTIIIALFAFLSVSRSTDYSTANAFYTRAIQTNPGSALALNNRGISLKNVGDIPAAVADFNSAVRLRPEYARAYYNRGNAYYSIKQYDTAMQDYNRTIRLDPGFAQAFNSRGLVKYFQKDFTGALEDYNKAISLEPNYAEVYNSRGSLQAELGYFPAAINDFETVVRLDPMNKNAEKNLAMARKDYANKQARPDASGGASDILVRQYNQKGINAAMKGDYRNAEKEFSEAIRLNPKFVDGYANRGNTRHALKDTEGACQDWTTAAGMGSTSAASMLKQFCK